jgi:hypothetical protein
MKAHLTCAVSRVLLIETKGMKTIFDKAIRSGLIDRINALDGHNIPLWGKMNLFQMTRHSVIWNEWMLGTHKPVYKQNLLGKIFGGLALRSNTKDDSPVGKNMPTTPDFIVREKEGDLAWHTKRWIKLIEEYEHYSNPDFIHAFFGKMTVEQIGILAYKHSDHHLRQFGV